MSKVVIFGTQDFAQLAYFYLSNDTEYEVVGFTVHRDFLKQNELLGLPVVPYESLENYFPPNQFLAFSPMSPKGMSVKRSIIYENLKSRSYKFISYISSKANYYGTKVGENCFILEGNTIQPFTEISDNVIMWSGNHLGHHSFVGKNSFLSSQVVISGHVRIGNNCFFGVNATVVDGVTIADSTFVGAGSLISHNTQPFEVYPGVKSLASKVPSNRLRGI
jgi:sugar O-acyltransferase (sialic acid O-acetyltransferase NeuD family)